ncbi:TPA: transposon-encoded TnpW family protein [Clostridioides difficile]|nr:transposon-encoded TnpW family protein [Clostridioides difficile]
MVREYQIGNTCYVVKSRSREQAKEDAVTKMKRLICNNIKKQV